MNSAFFYPCIPRKPCGKSLKQENDKVDTNYEFHKIITSDRTRHKTPKQKAVKTIHFLKAAAKLLGVSCGSCTV